MLTFLPAAMLTKGNIAALAPLRIAKVLSLVRSGLNVWFCRVIAKVENLTKHGFPPAREEART